MKNIGPYIKIVCEGGKTEPNYFNGWLNETYWQTDNRPIWERNPYTDVYQILLSLG
jgi:hypothetical protein